MLFKRTRSEQVKGINFRKDKREVSGLSAFWFDFQTQSDSQNIDSGDEIKGNTCAVWLHIKINELCRESSENCFSKRPEETSKMKQRRKNKKKPINGLEKAWLRNDLQSSTTIHNELKNIPLTCLSKFSNIPRLHPSQKLFLVFVILRCSFHTVSQLWIKWKKKSKH